MSDNVLQAYPVRYWVSRKFFSLNQRSQSAVASLEFDDEIFFEQQQIINKLQKKVPVVLEVSAKKIVLSKIKSPGLVLLNKQLISLAANVHLHSVNIFNWHEPLIPVSHDFSQLVRPTDRIFINHGKIILTVNSVEKNIIRVTVSRGGKIASGDTVMIAGGILDFDFSQPMADKLSACLSDYLSIPVASYKKIQQVKKMLSRYKGKLLLQVSQLRQINILPDVLSLVDGVLIDTLGLNLEVPQAKLSPVQKKLELLMKQKGKITIVSGQLPKD